MRKVLFTLLLFPVWLSSQLAGPGDGPGMETAVAGTPEGFELRLTVPRGHYSYRRSEISVPLSVRVKGLADGQKARVTLPDGERKGKEIILKGGFRVPVRLTGLTAGSRRITVEIGYQLCTDGPNPTCLQPQTALLTFTYTPSETGGSAVVSDSSAGTGSIQGKKDSGDSLIDTVRKNLTNPVVAFFLAILGGFLASLTPCVYPVIPITVGYFSKKSHSRGGRFVGALMYVAGMGLVYTLLGVISGFAGTAFGTFTNTPVFQIALGALFVALALSLFEVYEFRMPAKLSQLQGKSGGHGGSFVMGMVTGLVASPCVGPFLVYLLTGVLQAGKPALGVLLMAGFSIGMGILFFFLAVFSQSGAKLPKSGNWMVRVKMVLGFLVLGSALYFLKQAMVALAAPLWLMAGVGLLIILAVTVVAVLKMRRLYGGGSGHGTVLVVLALLLIGFFVLTYTAPAFLWNDLPDRLSVSVVDARMGDTDSRQKLGLAYERAGGEYRLKSVIHPSTVLDVRKLLVGKGVDTLTPTLWRAAWSGKLLFVDVGAHWCTTCHELEAAMLKSPSLLALLRRDFVPYKADLDREGDWLKKHLKVPGVPTLAVLRVTEKDGALMIGKVWERTSFDALDRYIPWLEAHLKGLLRKE